MLRYSSARKEFTPYFLISYEVQVLLIKITIKCYGIEMRETLKDLRHDHWATAMRFAHRGNEMRKACHVRHCRNYSLMKPKSSGRPCVKEWSGDVQIKLYIWTSKFEFHMNFTCHPILFFPLFVQPINTKKVLAHTQNWKIRKACKFVKLQNYS